MMAGAGFHDVGPASSEIRLSIVVPMYNEDAGLATFLEQIDHAISGISARQHLVSGAVEVIAVDDGSRDMTDSVLQQAAASRPWLRVVTHPNNRGLGAALWTGIEAARGELIATADSDCTYPLAEIADLWALLGPRTGVVTASPLHPCGNVVGVPRWRLLFSRTATLLYRLLVGTRVHTFTSMFRIYRRGALRTIPRRSAGFLAVTEMLVFPIINGVEVREYPTAMTVRRFGVSKMRIGRTILHHIGFMLWLIARKVR